MVKDYYRSKKTTDDITLDHRADILLDFIPDAKLQILDVGCGGGLFSKKAQKTSNVVVGIDVNPMNVGLARKRIDRVILQDTEDEWDIKNDSFDIVVLNAYLEHVFDYNFQIQEAGRVLKKDGFLLIMSPNSGSLCDRVSLLLGNTPRSFLNHEHIRQFTLPMLRHILERNNFSVVSQMGTLKWSKVLNRIFPAWWYCFVVKAIPTHR